MDTAPTLAEDIDAVSRIDVIKNILEVICRMTGMGFAAVARVTEQQWVACAVLDHIQFGLLPGGELKLETTICHDIQKNRQPVVIDHVAVDELYCGHATPLLYGFQSYISVPIVLGNGDFFGTLCAIDPKPAKVSSPQVRETFSLFADLIGRHLDAQKRLSRSEHALALERQTAGFRDQFMAVLGHDLRNPLGAILSATELLKYVQPGEETLEVIGMIERSGLRMVELIDNVLDFARGALGGGITVDRRVVPSLSSTLTQAAEELQLAWPDREINLDLKLNEPVNCDPARIGQVLSNLLANALSHGAAAKPVTVNAWVEQQMLRLSVTNQGATIPHDLQQQIFQPFSRGKAKTGARGLGLGLYIASEIAKAHGGSLGVQSEGGTTCFTLCIPIT